MHDVASDALADLRSHAEGHDHLARVDPDPHRERFGSSPFADFPAELARFEAFGWLDGDAPTGLLRLSPEGLAYSDGLGPELFSAGVRAAMAAYEPK